MSSNAIVVGDVICLDENYHVAADCIVIKATDLKAGTAAVNGECDLMEVSQHPSDAENYGD